MFSGIISRYSWQDISTAIYSATESDVAGTLSSGNTEDRDIINILSPSADRFIEDMARKACAVTRQRFGNVIQMYAPLYISNYCTNSCVYCGFSCRNDIGRTTLSRDDSLKEAGLIYSMGFRHILLLTGEDKKEIPPEILAGYAKDIHSRFSSVSVEVYPMSIDEYQLLCDSGVDGLTVYQETYNRDIYGRVHPSGKKRDYEWRLDTADRGGVAGMRKTGIGALLGLADWRVETFFTLLHARYLTQKYWKTNIQVSFPRLRKAAGGYNPEFTVTDRDLTHCICATRLILNDAGIALSTRESASLRNNLLPLGITMMSAGSKTEPGGYAHPGEAEKQFSVMDERSPEEVALHLKRAGFEPVWKDWDRNFL